MGEILMGLGIIVAFVGGIMLLIEAFRESVLWGIGSLLIGPVSLIFVILHWDVAKKPFFIQLVGLAVMLAGVALAG